MLRTRKRPVNVKSQMVQFIPTTSFSLGGSSIETDIGGGLQSFHQGCAQEDEICSPFST